MGVAAHRRIQPAAQGLDSPQVTDKATQSSAGTAVASALLRNLFAHENEPMDSRNAHKPSSAVQEGAGGFVADAFSIALICLVVLGLAGLLYKALVPGGWISALLDQLWTKRPWLVWLIGFGAASALAAAKWWLDRYPDAGRRSEALAYAFMALGLFFFFKLLVTGSL